MADPARTAQLPDTPPSDAISVRGLLIGGAVIAGAIVVAIIAGFVLVHVWSGARMSGATAPLPGHPPVIDSGRPALQPDPVADIEAYRAEKAQLLEEYGWVDRARGVVRIPVQRAMELLAARSGGGAR